MAISRHGDQWFNYTEKLCEQFETLLIGKQSTFHNDDGITNIIKRISFDTASHFMRFSYGESTPRECRRVNIKIQMFIDELDALKSDQKSMKMKIKTYEQKIEEIGADNMYKEEQLSQQTSQGLVNGQSIKTLNMELKLLNRIICDL